MLASQRQTLTGVERDFREALRIAKAAGDRESVAVRTGAGAKAFGAGV